MIVCDGEYSQLDKGFVCPDVYVFLAPYDGHVIVRFKTKYKTYMYDPSFGKGLLNSAAGAAAGENWFKSSDFRSMLISPS